MKLIDETILDVGGLRALVFRNFIGIIPGPGHKPIILDPSA